MNAAHHDLLFGLLALQNGLIDQGQLVAAFQAWTRDKVRPLAEHLITRGDLDAEQRSGIEAMVALHLKKHGSDAGRSLAAIPAGRSTRESLERIGDPEIGASIGHVGSARSSTEDGDPGDRTASFSVGSATSDGQRFRVLRPHARGGLGAIFVALDSELHREVALKQILDSHADDPISRQRFLVEAEITGGLEHPGVVPVYGLGTYSDGRPFYAMRFIKGDSLKEAIERFHTDDESKNDPSRRSLELRNLLRRFTDVCNAIDYAHSRGVLHRDIKPGNVIVGKHGETLVVDWGLAKAVGRTDPTSGERTLVPSSASGSADTLPGSVLGTPAYMSPEQAAGDQEQLGPRSDVYSLGATLYCLLNGRPPFEGDAGDVLRAVQRGNFPPHRKFDASIDRALEAVCLKAMAAKPEDRYASCRALSDDIERWTADEPVTAWREPFVRRLRRWAIRNRTAVTGAVVAVVVGVVGLSAVLAVQTRANAALAAANADLIRSQAAVQARYDLAVEAIKTFHTGVSEDFLLTQDQFKEVRDRLLRSASDFYGKLGALLGNESDLASRCALWQANYEVAVLTGKVGKKEDALAAHRQVLAARESLAAESPADPDINADVARSLTAIASLLEATGRTEEAEVTYRKAEKLLVGLAPTMADPAVARAALGICRSSLGWLLHITGRNEEAISVYRKAREDQEEVADAPRATAGTRRDLAITINRVAILLSKSGKSLEAEGEYRESLAIQHKLADDNPAVTQFRSNLALTHFNLGILLADAGKSSAAEVELREALAIQQKVADDNPAVTEFRNVLAGCHSGLGWLLHQRGKSSEAVSEYREAIAIQQRLADGNPAVTDFRSRLAGTHNSLGSLLASTGSSSEAEAEYREAIAIQQRLADDNFAVTNFRDRLARSYNSLGTLLLDTGKSSEAEGEHRKALTIQQKLADDNPGIPQFQRNLAGSLLHIGWLLAQAGKTVEAIGFYTREEAIRQKLAQASSAMPADSDSLANCQINMADVLRRSGKLDKALAACERALAVREPLVEGHHENRDYRAGLGETYLRLGQVRCDMGNAAQAADAWKRALANYDGSKGLSGEHTFFLACCHTGLAGLAGRPGSGVSVAEGAEQAEKAMTVLRQAVSMGYRNSDACRTESALDPLRSRPDFRLLMMDLAMPAVPYAP